MMESTDRRKLQDAQESMYNTEHGLALLMAGVGFLLAVLATLVGFGIIELRDGAAPFAGAVDDFDGTQTLLSNHFWDAAMLFFAAMTAGMLAYCLHASEHHRMHVTEITRSEGSLWGAEHMLSYLIGLGAIVYVIIGLLVGFNAFNDTHDQGDGLIWIWFGFAASIVTTALHAVSTHQQETEEDYIIEVVEERVRRLSGTGTTTGTPTTRPGMQRGI
jgi:hypothetical protein